MFSRRTSWNATSNRLAQATAQRLARGLPVLDLTESNPTRVGFGVPADELARALATTAAARYAPDPLGLRDTRDAIADYHRARGLAVDAEHLLVSASTSESYAWLFKLLAEPGDAVLVPAPSYPLFEYLAGLESVETRAYPLLYDGEWHLDFDALEAAVTARTRAIVVVHPNNPTGSFLKQDEMRRLGELCARRGLALIGDEVFSDFALEPDPRRARSVLDAPAPLSFALGGLSKAVAQPQLKIGWTAVGGADARLVTEAMARLEIIADTFLSANTPAQLAVPALLAGREAVQGPIRARLRANVKALREEHGPGAAWQPLRTEGGWSAVLRLPRARTEEEWAIALVEEDGVLAHPGYFFDFPSEAFLAVSLIVEEARFRDGVRRIDQRIR